MNDQQQYKHAAYGIGFETDREFLLPRPKRRWWQRLMFWKRDKTDQWTPAQLAILEAKNMLPLEINRIAKFYKPPTKP